jgi:hypothetical protein
MIYILSCVVHKFFSPAGDFVVHQHFDFTLLGPDDHALASHAAYHIEGIHRTPPKGKLQDVLRHALLQRLFQVVGDLEEPVGRTQAADPLVGTLVIVIVDPEGTSLHRLVEAVELGPLEEFGLDRLPESLDFTKCHWMVGARSNVLHAVLFHLSFEAGLPSPIGVLAAIVGEHLPGNAVFGNTATVCLQHVFGGLTAIQPQAGNVAAVVIHEADQVSVAPCQPERHDVALPQLVGTRSFEKPRFGRILHRLAFRLVYQSLGGQGFMDC